MCSGLTIDEAEYLSVARFRCDMDPKFFDYTVLELTKWADVIDKREFLNRDLQIISQVIKLVEKAKAKL